jgi:hypothetical protein
MDKGAWSPGIFVRPTSWETMIFLNNFSSKTDFRADSITYSMIDFRTDSRTDKHHQIFLLN